MSNLINVDTSGAQLTGAGYDAVLIPSAAYPVGTVLSSQLSPAAAATSFITAGAGICVFINPTNVGGAGTVQVFIEGFDVASSTWFAMFDSGVLAAATPKMLQIAPGLPTAANSTLNGITPRQLRARAVVAGNAVTFSVGASVVAL